MRSMGLSSRLAGYWRRRESHSRPAHLASAAFAFWLLISAPALAQAPASEARARDAQRQQPVRPESEEITPEDARRALRHRLEELHAERARLESALAALDGDGGIDASRRVLLPEDRLRLLRSWRERDEQRGRRGVFGPAGVGRDGSGLDGDDRSEGPRHRPTGPGDPSRPAVTPERLEALREFIRESNPLLWAELERLRAQSPERFERMLAEQARGAFDDREGFEHAMRLDRADRELRQLVERLAARGGPLRGDDRAALRERIAMAYEARMALLGHRLQRMQERVDDMRAQHERMGSARETLIDQRLSDIEAELMPGREPDAEPTAGGQSPDERPAGRRRPRGDPRGGDGPPQRTPPGP